MRTPGRQRAKLLLAPESSMPTPWSTRLISLTVEINKSSDKRQPAGEARVSRIRKAKVSQLYRSRAWTAGRGALRFTPWLSGTSNTGTRQSWRKKSCPWSVLSHTSRQKRQSPGFRATAADSGETRRPEKRVRIQTRTRTQVPQCSVNTCSPDLPESQVWALGKDIFGRGIYFLRSFFSISSQLVEFLPEEMQTGLVVLVAFPEQESPRGTPPERREPCPKWQLLPANSTCLQEITYVFICAWMCVPTSVRAHMHTYE